MSKQLVIKLTVTPKEKRDFKAAARSQERSLASWLRRLAKNAVAELGTEVRNNG